METEPERGGAALTPKHDNVTLGRVDDVGPAFLTRSQLRKLHLFLHQFRELAMDVG